MKNEGNTDYIIYAFLVTAILNLINVNRYTTYFVYKYKKYNLQKISR